ncbi:MAG: peroxiredoxin-like family protein [Cyclobacteriaceae bacterium]
MIKIHEKFPDLTLPTIDGEEWNLTDNTPENFTMLVFYRGYHCPVCKKYNSELQEKLDKFTDLGVNVMAISCDSEERAMKTKDEWDMNKLPVAYEMPVDIASQLGLYISESISDSEPFLFSEPALFLLKPDMTVHAAYYQSMPFARPPLDDLLKGIEFILDKDYPARGTHETQLERVH